jgi:soluble lytic murein transglycosylase-like protein
MTGIRSVVARMLRRLPRRATAVAGVVLLGLGPAAAAPADPALEAQFVALRGEARSYEHGEGVPRDPSRALALYCEAAKLGDPEAQYSLGWMYANGRGAPRDDALAAYFFWLAAWQGHEHAQRMLRFVGDESAEPPSCMRESPPPEVEVVTIPDEPFLPANPEQKKVADLVHRLAPEFRVSPRLVLAVIRAESNFDALAVSPKNAQGLMQLIPDTAARFNVRKPFDPVQNIRGGLAYLRWLLAYYQGDVTLVAAAYNAGEKAVDRYRGIPPYAETRAYVTRILQFYRKVAHPYDATVTDPSPELSRVRVVKAP